MHVLGALETSQLISETHGMDTAQTKANAHGMCAEVLLKVAFAHASDVIWLSFTVEVKQNCRVGFPCFE